jgi:hypothetical protein
MHQRDISHPKRLMHLAPTKVCHLPNHLPHPILLQIPKQKLPTARASDRMQTVGSEVTVRRGWAMGSSMSWEFS